MEVAGVAELEENIDLRYDNEKMLVAELAAVVSHLDFPADLQEAMCVTLTLTLVPLSMGGVGMHAFTLLEALPCV
jgi:hypothetical protein